MPWSSCCYFYDRDFLYQDLFLRILPIISYFAKLDMYGGIIKEYALCFISLGQHLICMQPRCED